MGKHKIQPGDRYEKLTVLYQLPEKRNGRNVYHFQCDCGNEVDITSSALSQTKSCGCAKRQASKAAFDLTGLVFGELTVLEKDYTKKAANGSYYWRCKCSCGKETSCRPSSLRSGHTKTCGDISHQTQKYLNQTFGYLTVIEYDHQKRTDKSHYQVKCLCDCGNIIHAQISNLKSGKQISCGCKAHLSKGEEKIKTILTKNNINFETQKTFNDLINPKTNCKLKFDFFLPDYNIIIEYNGEQHTQEIPYWGGKEGLKERQERDEIKENWFLSHPEYTFIKISYLQYDKLSLQDLLVL